MLQTLVDTDGGVVGSWDVFCQVFDEYLSDRDDATGDNYKNRVRVCVANLRKKIDPDQQFNYVQTVGVFAIATAS